MTGLEIALLATLLGLVAGIIGIAIGKRLYCKPPPAQLPTQPAQPTPPSPEEVRKKIRADRLQRAAERLAKAEEEFDIATMEKETAELLTETKKLKRESREQKQSKG